MGTKDILEPRRGALVAREDPVQFADAVKRLLQNEFLHKRLSKEAREYVKEWSAPMMAERLLAYYQQLLHSGQEKRSAQTVDTAVSGN